MWSVCAGTAEEDINLQSINYDARDVYSFVNRQLAVTSGMNTTSPMDPLAWWKLHDSRFPRISKLARKYLAIPASSAPSERVFSRAKLIQQRQRWNLLPQRLEACIMLKHNAWVLSS